MPQPPSENLLMRTSSTPEHLLHAPISEGAKTPVEADDRGHGYGSDTVKPAQQTLEASAEFPPSKEKTDVSECLLSASDEALSRVHQDAKDNKGGLLEDTVNNCLSVIRLTLLQQLGKLLDYKPKLNYSPSASSSGFLSAAHNGDASPMMDHDFSFRTFGSHGSATDSYAVSGLSSRMPQKRRSSLPTLRSVGSFHSSALSEGSETSASYVSAQKSGVWNGVTLWPIWQQEAPRVVGKPSRQGSSSSLHLFDSTTARTGDILRGQGCCQKLVLRPSSPSRIIWDVLSVLFMGYDVLLIPMMVFKDDIRIFVMTVMITVFWTLDMVVSFLGGFDTAGIIEMRPTKIATRYLRTWFLLDLVVVVGDWFSLLAERSSSTDSFGAVRVTKSLRVARVLRVLRFLRIWKVMRMISGLADFIHSASLLQLAGIAKFIVVILLINHYLACAWYAVAEYHPSGEKTTWLSALDQDNHDSSVFYYYVTSLHWSFTQFTPASMEVVPRNSLERVFCVCVVLSGLVIFSSFVSGITSAMTALREMNKERTRQEEFLRQYVSDNRISLDLGRRIHNFVRLQGYAARPRLVEDDVVVFKLLPQQLSMDLHTEVFLPRMVVHPLFHQFVEADERGLVEVVHESASETAVVKGEHVFDLEQRGSKMCFVIAGGLWYFLGDALSSTEIRDRDYVAEAVLWVKWLHKGRLEATGYCVIVQLRATDFHTLLTKTPSFASCQRYAQMFAQLVFIASQSQEEAKDPTSLEAPDTPKSKRSTSSKKRRIVLSDIWQDFDKMQEMAQISFEEQLNQVLCKNASNTSWKKSTSALSMHSALAKPMQAFKHALHVASVSGSGLVQGGTSERSIRSR